MQPNTKSRLCAWLPSRGNVLFSLSVATLLVAQGLGAFSQAARTAEGANSLRPTATPSATPTPVGPTLPLVKQTNAVDHRDIGPNPAQADDLTLTFAPGEISVNAYILVDWHVTVYDKNTTGCRAAAASRLNGDSGVFTDLASYQEVAISHTGLEGGVQTMSGSTVYEVGPGAHAVTLVLRAQDCGTRTFYVRSMRVIVTPR